MRAIALLIAFGVLSGCDEYPSHIERAEDAKVSCWRVRDVYASSAPWHCDETVRKK